VSDLIFDSTISLVRSKILILKSYLLFLLVSGRMTTGTKLDEKLEGANDFRARKYRVMLILEENDLESFVEQDIEEPEADEAKAKYKKDSIKEKRIIVDSIKNHLIPQVSALKTPKQMMDALSRLFEGKNINWKMTLRTQLMNVKMQNSETIQSYFTRVSQIKEQLEAIGESVEEVEITMTTLNGLPNSWESFILLSPSLGITKEIMSRGPHVLDMEYREPY
jgi:hypothetical protein